MDIVLQDASMVVVKFRRCEGQAREQIVQECGPVVQSKERFGPVFLWNAGL